MLASVALVGCTNTDEPEVNNGNENESAGKAYVSVKLVMTNANGSRAVKEHGFAVGELTEQTISIAADKSIFLFYDKDGKWVTSGQIVNGNVSTENKVDGDHKDLVNDLSGEVYVVLNGPDQSLTKVEKVLTVVNYNGADKLKNLNLNQALDVITNAQENNPASTKDLGFLMSTSVYYNNGEVNVTAIDPKTQICTTQEDAKLNPVKIYIERASAKFQINWEDSYAVEADGETTDEDKNEDTEETEDDVVVDGELKVATIKILGYTLNNYNTTTNLVKDITGFNEDSNKPFDGWNFATNFRSYWAKGTQYNYDPTKDECPLEVHTFTEASNTDEKISYVYEHTVATPNVVANRATEVAQPNVTTVLIAAQFSVPDYTGSFYKYGGVFYKENSYLNLISKQLADAGYFVQDATDDKKYNHIPASSFTISEVTDKLAKITVTLKEGEYYQLTEADGVTTATKVEDLSAPNQAIAALSYVTEIEAYKDGKCFYQIPIEHLGEKYGVVRNHWYKMNINAVKHIGKAVYNETIEIPQIPAKDTEHYLAAEIHVLSWHVVEQDVTLE